MLKVLEKLKSKNAEELTFCITVWLIIHLFHDMVVKFCNHVWLLSAEETITACGDPHLKEIIYFMLNNDIAKTTECYFKNVIKHWLYFQLYQNNEIKHIIK